MPLTVFSKSIEDHPITELQYELVTGLWPLGDRTLKLTTLAHVEQSIDLVFEWLESKGLDAGEIEKLAPYFGVVWPSATALCGYLGQPQIRKNLSGKTIVELGCGLAVPSIVCAKSGGMCTAVDNHPSVPVFLTKNIEQNEPCDIRFVASHDVHQISERFDWIIASDVLYEKSLGDVFATMVTELAKPNTKCVVADPGRPYIQEFVHAMNRLGWIDRLEPWSVPHKGQICDVYIMVFERPLT